MMTQKTNKYKKFGSKIQKASLKSINELSIPFHKVEIDLIGSFIKIKICIDNYGLCYKYLISIVIPNNNCRSCDINI